MTPDGQAPLPARLNPFRSECLHRLAFLPHPSAEDSVFATLEQSGWTGGIVGPHGSGKTTLLLRLQDMMHAQDITTEFFQCREEGPPLSSRDWNTFEKKCSGSVLLLDGADLLPRLHWGRLRRLARAGCGLLATAHHDLKGFPTVYTTDPSPDRLAELIAQLHPRILDGTDPETLYRKHGGNIREALRDLYDRCAGLMEA
jgi:energy-coupling factor transporter ATP-binding protein EcfA2